MKARGPYRPGFLAAGLVLDGCSLVRIPRVPKLSVFATFRPTMLVLLFRYVFGAIGVCEQSESLLAPGAPDFPLEFKVTVVTLKKLCSCARRQRLVQRDYRHAGQVQQMERNGGRLAEI